MNCYKCKKLIDKIHLDCINDNELQSVLHHIQKCQKCNAYYNVMNEMLKELSSLEEKELPEGFHNKLHFALKREAEAPTKSKKPLMKGFKIAAIGACSVLVVLAAVSLLPNMKSYDAIMPNMAMEEAAEAPEARDSQNDDMDVQAMPAEIVEEVEAEMLSEDDGETNSYAADSTTDAAEGESTDKNEPSACSSIVHGGSVILILDVEDIDLVYNELLPHFPDALADTTWVIADFDEPSEYKSLRALMDIAEADHLAGDIASEYARNIELYASRIIEYDNMDEEIADLQNIGYVYIVIK